MWVYYSSLIIFVSAEVANEINKEEWGFGAIRTLTKPSNCEGICITLQGVSMRDFFLKLSPLTKGMLKVSDLHPFCIGKSAAILKDNLSSSCMADPARVAPDSSAFLRSEKFIVLFFVPIKEGFRKIHPCHKAALNTAWDLVKDTETIREMLKIDKWVVFGGSWGSTLVLAYAITHPERVKALVLRGIFLCRPSEIRWFYQRRSFANFPWRVGRISETHSWEWTIRHGRGLLQTPDSWKFRRAACRPPKRGASGKRQHHHWLSTSPFLSRNSMIPNMRWVLHALFA